MGTNAGNLNSVGREAGRGLHGTRNMDSAAIAIHGANAENILLANAISYMVNGLMYSNAADAEIDISAEVTVPANLADLSEQIFVLCIDSAGAYSFVTGNVVLNADIDSGDKLSHWPEDLTDDVCPIAAIKVKNASGADFILGTTLLSAAGIADTYYNLGVVPANGVV